MIKILIKVTDLSLLRKVQETIRIVKNATNLMEIPNIKKLKSKKNYYRIRIGDYRLGISLENNEVTFIRIRHRREIYRKFPP
ncbi:MAG: type II toxin-antitoxin system RelE family toxin [Microcystaceae cyanobacterium]